MNTPIRILYLEDEVNDVELAVALLDRANIDHKIIHVSTRNDFLAALEHEELDLILSDYSLPSFDGLTALSMAREKLPEVPFILVTGQMGEEVAIESLKAGAKDYVLKQKRARLAPAVLRAMSEAEEHRQRLQAEAELRRLMIAIDQSAEIIIVTDLAGTIQYTNPAFEQVTNYLREEAIGKNMRLLKSGRHDKAFYDEMWNTIRSGKVWSGNFTNMKKDGTLYEEEATISPVRDENGQITNYVAVKRDVTERAMHERQMRQAQKLEAIGTLAGGIAHDFNNILTAIIGYGQMAAESLPENSPEHCDLNQALSAAYRAKDLVRQILTFSRHREMEHQSVHLHLIIGEVLELLRPSLPATIEIRCDIDRNCGPVSADPSQMCQVFMNLCTNSYMAMKETGGMLSVSLGCVRLDGEFIAVHPELSEGNYVKLSVTDTGKGMDKETLDRIFEPFFTTKKEGEGTGMGLSTVHGIVKACGGAIAVDSELGKGTSFDVYLPLADIDTQHEEQSNEPIQGGTERLLVVDDEQALANLIGRQLKSFGYDVSVATSTSEALRVVRERPQYFDLIITDVVMPDMTGYQLIREVMRLRTDLPVISISGGDNMLSPEEAEKSGIRMFMKKPLSKRDFASAVRKVLNEAKAANTPPPEGVTDSHTQSEEI
jgi:PAS domain S-box-containing protein